MDFNKTEQHVKLNSSFWTLPNGKIALLAFDNLDSFDDGTPTFKRMVAYGTTEKWLWIHKDFKP
jgi:hypothetical protein